MSGKQTFIGGIEAGGTKFVCAVGDVDGNVLLEERFPTTTPAETFAGAIEFFQKASEQYGELSKLGIGTFGPAGVNPKRDDYGKILVTPKQGWEGADFVGTMQRAFPNAEIVFDTDVNAAALGEGLKGAAQGFASYVYVTIGTGIGGGVVVDGRTLSGLLHPEIGHISVPQLDDFEGVCPFHGNCVEGMASGTAIAERWGTPAYELAPEHPAWQLEAKYLAHMCRTLTAILSPEKIILGGGVMEQAHLLELVRAEFNELNGGYWPTPTDYIVTPDLGNQAGITGCLALVLG